ncbi:Na+/H+ antiporter NhaC family protein [Faecalibacter macacae]|uniref:Na+/H+ antiporter NhaC family protein n=1 Tax=Faecalibacter macacae TaxID=1859289 RepID=A0A3L9M6J1_9FLAO|nr:Na+/H+ antiporter NhaC family protein [Faecalibacter macacae]RLZ07536.1 Na+/H+ antiporter NhaC family protein [Faecalibacter macacae]
MKSKKGNFWALLPLIAFILIYFTSSVILNDFYAVPAIVVFMVALIIAMVQFPKVSFNAKIEAFCKGAGEETIVLMILIFLLAGAFGSLGSTTGAVASTVNMFVSFLPPGFIVVGFFLIACFISVSIGTSVGTIVTLAPIAVEMEKMIPGSMAMLLGAVVGGAMFGDNLSFISDTTIAATRTQEVDMKSKFKANFKIVLPAAIFSILLYYFLSQNFNVVNIEGKNLDYDLLTIVPYLLVFGLAIGGVNVIWSLIIGILSFLAIGIFYQSIPFLELVTSINNGFTGMFELSILCLIIGGVVGIIRYNGGLEYIIEKLTKNIKSKKQAELSIAGLIALADAALANNTIAILIVGRVAKEISNEHDLEPKRVASILDTVSCFVQGVIPYGAQILAAVAVTKIAKDNTFMVSPLDVISNLYYPFLTGICVLIFILFINKKSSKPI